MWKSNVSAFIALLLSVGAPQAHAELASTMTALVVKTDADGAERFEIAAQVKPGDTVEYRIVHRNDFDESLNGLAVVGPVPPEMELIGAGYSVDIPAIFEVQGEFDPDRPGEEWSALPAMKTVVDENGLRHEEVADKADFTAVRWRLTEPLPASGTVRHVYRTAVK